MGAVLFFFFRGFSAAGGGGGASGFPIFRSTVIKAACLLLALTLPAWGQLDTPEWRKTLRELHAAQHPWAMEVARQSAKPPETDPNNQWQHWSDAKWDFIYAVMLEEADHPKSLAKFREAVETWGSNAVSTERIKWLKFTHDGYWYPILHKALLPYVPEADKQAWIDGLDAKARWATGMRLSDSDQFVGCYGLIEGTDVVLGTNYLPEEWVVKKQEYVRTAAGGEWHESSQYNPTTMFTLLSGCAAVGWDRHPDVKALLPDLAEQARWHITPDYKEAVSWGDDEFPHVLMPWSRLPYLMFLAKLANKPELNHLVAKIGYDNGWFGINGESILLLVDPRDIPDEPVYEHPTGLRQTNVGLLIYRTPDTLVQVFNHNLVMSNFVDHRMAQWAVRVWYRGDWVTDHPIGYMPWSRNFTGSECYGFPGPDDRRMLPAKLIDGGFEVEIAAKGPPGIYWGWETPTVTIDQWTRKHRFTGRKLETTDEVTILGQPIPPPDVKSYGWWYWNQRIAPLAQFWHAQREVAATASGFTWLSRGGTPMRLTTDAPIRTTAKVELGTNVGVYVPPPELGGTLMQLGADKTITTAIEWGPQEPDPPIDVPVTGVIRGKQLIIELP
jgi:hypothetical protein